MTSEMVLYQPATKLSEVHEIMFTRVFDFPLLLVPVGVGDGGPVWVIYDTGHLEKYLPAALDASSYTRKPAVHVFKWQPFGRFNKMNGKLPDIFAHIERVLRYSSL